MGGVREICEAVTLMKGTSDGGSQSDIQAVRGANGSTAPTVIHTVEEP